VGWLKWVWHLLWYGKGYCSDCKRPLRKLSCADLPAEDRRRLEAAGEDIMIDLYAWRCDHCHRGGECVLII
jgi:hypothetical protein